MQSKVQINTIITGFLPSTTTKSLPKNQLSRMAVKLYMLGALAWDYTETVRDIASNMRLKELRVVSRQIRELHEDYDRFRGTCLSIDDTRRESELSVEFENICADHFSRLCFGIASDKILAGLNKESVLLIKSVQMALTVIDAMNMYASDCDKFIRGHGVDGHSILVDHFRKLSILLPQYAGDCYNPNNEARQVTAKILYQTLKGIDIYDENGKV